MHDLERDQLIQFIAVSATCNNETTFSFPFRYVQTDGFAKCPCCCENIPLDDDRMNLEVLEDFTELLIKGQQ